MTGGGLQVRVLGPTQLSRDGAAVVLPRQSERAFAVRLALAHGAVVRDDLLARALWGDVDLARPAERLRVLASRLRAGLAEAADALHREPGGYRLDGAAVDLARAEEVLAAVQAARAADDTTGARKLAADAVALWRGPALADLRTVPFAAAEGERIDGLFVELRLAMLSAEVELGAAAAACSELEQLAAEHPLHERVICQLAVALYVLGRQAEALERLARLKAVLADELGVDPTPETMATELRILRQAPDLGPARDAVPAMRLPMPAGTFVGRDSECRALQAELAEPGLITLTGMAGSGKTRLALEIAHLEQGRRPVAWVDLAPLTGPDAVLPALAVAAGLDADTPHPLPRVAAALERGLLVMDNAEHIVEAAADAVSMLLRHGERLSVLVTSQRPLLVSREEVHRVGPLTPTAAAMLFCERASVARNADVDAICAAVDHLPLGVELAAGLTRTLTVPQIAARVDDRLRLLAGGSRDAGIRHTSLRAALDWSYRLLDDRGQAALRRLAVFAGGCTLDAAEAVLADEHLARADIAAVLADLDERNLLVVRGQDAAPRFLLLESVHDYAAEQLALDADEAAATRRRHLAWCTAHVRAHDVQGSDAAAALDAVFAEWPNLLRALDSAVGTERAADALRLALALDDAWMFRGLHNQARRHYGPLADAPGLSDAERAQALSNYAFASTLAGDHAAAGDLLDRAAQHADRAHDPVLRMRVLYHRGIWFVEEGRPVEALGPLREGARIALAEGREQSASAFDDVIATALLYSGDAEAAAQLYHRANESDRRGGRTHGLVRGLVNEATALLSLERIDAAQHCADEGLELARALHDPVAESTLRAVAGQAALTRGETRAAVRALRAALTELTPGEIDAHLCELDLADALTVAGKLDAARQAVRSVLDASEQRGVVWLLAQPTLAEVTARQGDPAAAVELLATAEQLYAERGFRWPIAMRRLERARAAVTAA